MSWRASSPPKKVLILAFCSSIENRSGWTNNAVDHIIWRLGWCILCSVDNRTIPFTLRRPHECMVNGAISCKTPANLGGIRIRPCALYSIRIFSPLVATVLVKNYGNLAPAAMYPFFALMALLGMFLSRKTSGDSEDSPREIANNTETSSSLSDPLL